MVKRALKSFSNTNPKCQEREREVTESLRETGKYEKTKLFLVYSCLRYVKQILKVNQLWTTGTKSNEAFALVNYSMAGKIVFLFKKIQPIEASLFREMMAILQQVRHHIQQDL
ncbi:unnamed protein product [Sphenostylis stenocarpa]|uniref:Uncharacterized protein n=1 Tax=Sphenostylis stenocarpa TaxID=92480 RepID=A0AA86SE31_9FABA|nr:unnamed protein product [Sphenostylis stenocarpa]